MPLLGSNQDSPDPESGVLPITPRGNVGPLFANSAPSTLDATHRHRCRAARSGRRGSNLRPSAWETCYNLTTCGVFRAVTPLSADSRRRESRTIFRRLSAVAGPAFASGVDPPLAVFGRAAAHNRRTHHAPNLRCQESAFKRIDSDGVPSTPGADWVELTGAVLPPLPSHPLRSAARDGGQRRGLSCARWEAMGKL